jgi:hypothetical protein
MFEGSRRGVFLRRRRTWWRPIWWSGHGNFLTLKVFGEETDHEARVAIEPDHCQAAVDGLAAVNSIFEDRASL